jgi:putative protein-disulfide isomerase
MDTLFYIHDPMCSWCYGFSSALSKLTKQLPDSIIVIRLLGGLAPDTDEPMSDEMRNYVQTNWHKIEKKIPGVVFNYDFWSKCAPRRSTYLSCRAVIAAREQGEQYDELMTKAIQHAYYQQARNPSDSDTLIELAGELSLDVKKFSDSLNSKKTRLILEQEIFQAAEMGVASYPNLRLQVGNSNWRVAIDYNDAGEMLGIIEMLRN